MSASKIVLETTALRDKPDGLIRELYAAGAPLHAEAAPHEPRPPLEQVLATARYLAEGDDGATVVARDGTGQIVGSADMITQDLAGFRHIAHITIGVLPGHRRAGTGRALLAGAVELADRSGRTLLMSITRDTVPAGEAFARRIGAGVGQVAIQNRLDLRAVDRALVRSWLDAGPSRAPGYHLEFVAGATPDRLLPGAVAMLAMTINTAPHDDLQVGHVTVTPEQFRQKERAVAAAGRERWAYYAVHDATGDVVGLTDVLVRPTWLEQIQVGNTVVDPAHRGRALGKWLKAAMTQRVLDNLPAAHWLITGNAASNDAMLAINRQLGYVPSAAITFWQVSIERARTYLCQVSLTRHPDCPAERAGDDGAL